MLKKINKKKHFNSKLLNLVNVIIIELTKYIKSKKKEIQSALKSNLIEFIIRYNIVYFNIEEKIRHNNEFNVVYGFFLEFLPHKKFGTYSDMYKVNLWP